MKKILYLSSTFLFLGVIFLAFAFPAKASQPEAVEITFKLDITGPLSGAGTFNLVGAFEDAGWATQVGKINGQGTLEGDKILEGQYGTIQLRFIAKPGQNLDASGHFVIVSGTGAYENILGQGTTYAAIVYEDGVPKIVGTYSGSAHIEP